MKISKMDSFFWTNVKRMPHFHNVIIILFVIKVILILMMMSDAK